MKKILFLFIAVAMYSLNISAQSDCATATALPNLAGGGSHTETAIVIVDATLGGIGGGAGSYDAAWFSFTPTQGGLIDVSACLGGADTRVYIHDNCAGPSIADNDDACAFAPDGTGSAYASAITGQAVTGGTTYYIEWDDRWEVGPFDWSITYTAVNAPDCATLTAPADASIDQPTALDLTWDAAATGSAATSYDVYFGTTSGALPMVGNQAGTTYSTTGLIAGTTYYWSVNPVNIGGTTDCSGTEYSFTIATILCEAPTAVAVSGITLTDAMVTWVDGAGCVTDQIVTVTPAVAGSPFSVACGVQSLDLTGLLTEATSYTVAVANNCGALPSASAAFDSGTPGTACATATVLPDLAGGGTHSETATTIVAGSLGGIGDATTRNAAWFSFTPTEDGTITVSSCLGGADTRVYIHDNCAGPSITSSDDACPFAPSGTGSAYASEVADLAVTTGTAYYIEWDDRWGAGPFDWSISFSPAPVPCVGAPTNATATATGGGNVLFTWDAMADTELYQVKYRERGTTPWTSFGTVITQRNQVGFDDNKQYQYKMRRRCVGGGWSEYTAAAIFPGFYSNDCPEASGIASIYLDNTTFKVRWDDNGEVKGRVRYREVGTTPWLIKYGVPGNNYAYVTGLTADADYEYRVRVNCEGDNWSPYDALYFHNLGSVSSRISQELTGVRLYPNPASDVLNITYDNELGAEVTVEVFDMLGRAIISEISNNNQAILNVGQLNAGTYIVSIMTDGKQSIQKFVKK
ncbi:MAG: hypothetical protein ACI94Y_000152 [Maribacter sp.]|jgi:hypothetical protein